MTKDEIIKLAREAGLPMAWISDSGVVNWTDLEAFANLVAAAEREACAKVCEAGVNSDKYLSLTECAAAIRARGNT